MHASVEPLIDDIDDVASYKVDEQGCPRKALSRDDKLDQVTKRCSDRSHQKDGRIKKRRRCHDLLARGGRVLGARQVGNDAERQLTCLWVLYMTALCRQRVGDKKACEFTLHYSNEKKSRKQISRDDPVLLVKGNDMSNEGNKVRVNYIGTFDDGTVFDSSVERGEPLEFTCMAGMMIPGFDAAVNEMAVGETKKVHIPAADAYGERDEQLVQRIPKENVPDVDDLPVGQTVYMQAPGGQAFPVKVVEITDDDVVFDMNHEMAGKDLNFEITLEEVLD